ncbi:MAG: Na+/H+ antiporter [Anaerolineales bacterium]|jgi:CPA1 family monovalent cation:H+ antiporter
MDSLIRIQTLVIGMLLVAALVALIVRRFRIPYTVALVLAGLVLSFGADLDFEITPELILSLLVPPLVFEAAFYLNLDELRRNLGTIALMAVPGVILNMILVGAVVTWGAGLSLPMALVFGSLIAATDPVAVVAIFRKIGAPSRLAVLLEGESLLNDGTAIVIFNLAVTVALTGNFQLLDGVLDFLRVAGGGVIVGVVLGWLVARLIARIDDHLVETTLTTVLAFGSYLVAESLMHVSGVLAVVAAGLVSGSIGPSGMRPTTRIVVINFWDYTAFLANSAVFLLIGLQLDLPELLANWQTILWAIGAVLVSRAFVVYVFSRIGSKIRRNWRHVLFWGGLRGAISLALALSIPVEVGPERNTVITMAFGVVLFTLLGQGLSMGWVLRRFRVIFRTEAQMEYEIRHARAIAARAGFTHLSQLHEAGLISSHTWENLRKTLLERTEALAGSVQQVMHDAPELEIAELMTARTESLRAQRAMLANLRRDGVISDEAHGELAAEIDVALETGAEAWAEQVMQSHAPNQISLLMAVIVQDRDLESASNALADRGISITEILSQGGLLRQRNHLLLVGIPEGKLEMAVEALQRACRRRVEYVSTPLPGIDVPLTTPVPVQVQGATVFVFKVERSEVL